VYDSDDVVGDDVGDDVGTVVVNVCHLHARKCGLSTVALS
jgi:hypothetical protein